MKRVFFIAMISVLTCMVAHADYINPVIWGSGHADPGVFRDTDGTYYLYTWAYCYKSTDLVNWKAEESFTPGRRRKIDDGR